jgi:hypothetical protein
VANRKTGTCANQEKMMRREKGRERVLKRLRKIKAPSIYGMLNTQRKTKLNTVNWLKYFEFFMGITG